MMRNRRKREKGSAIIEAAFMMPWIAFLFVGVMDVGFYTHAAMATQNAARAVAVQQASGALADACQTAQREMGFLPNVPGTSCASTQANVTNTTPIWVCFASPLTSVASSQCGQPSRICADCDPGICPAICVNRSVQAVVTYQSIPMVPIPGIIPGNLRLTRIAEARIIE